MSFWYSEIRDEKPISWAEGKEPHWYDGLVSLPDSLSATGTKASVSWFIDWPARMIGNSIVPIYAVLGLAGSIAAGYFLTRWLSVKIGRPASIFAGCLAGIYLAAVLYRSQHWAAFALLNSMKD